MTSSKKVAIVQSNYIPWKGYFDLMARWTSSSCYDDVQYTKRDWRNRNRMKTPNGAQWLTIPVQVKGRYRQRIDETFVSDPRWGERHWATLRGWYGKAPFFAHYREIAGEPVPGHAAHTSCRRSTGASWRRCAMLLGHADTADLLGGLSIRRAEDGAPARHLRAAGRELLRIGPGGAGVPGRGALPGRGDRGGVDELRRLSGVPAGAPAL